MKSLLAIIVCLLAGVSGVQAQTSASTGAQDRSMAAFIGGTVIIPVEDPEEVTIDRRDILNYLEGVPDDERRIVLTSLRQGIARVTVVKGGVTTVYTVAVTDPNEDDRARLIKDMVGAPGLDVRFVGGAIVLQGEVEDDIFLRKAINVANTFSPSVLNFVNVTRPLQVRIKVQVVSVTMTKDSNIGVEYGPLNADGTGLAVPFGFSQFGQGGFPFFNTTNVAGLPIGAGGGGFPVPQFPGVRLFGADVNAAINLAQNVGKVKILQEPTLTVLNGQSSVFRVGGEFPVLERTFDTNGNVTVTAQYRPFGISLLVTPLLEETLGMSPAFAGGGDQVGSQPLQTYGMRDAPNVPVQTAQTIDRNGIIRMFVRPEISSLDFANVNDITPFPTVLQRLVETRVAMKHRESLVIGGLFDDQMEESLRSVPFISKIPVLGELFKNRSKEGEKTEIAFILTPEVIGREQMIAGDRPQPRLSEMAEQLDYAGIAPSDVKPVKISAETVGLRSAEFVKPEKAAKPQRSQATAIEATDIPQAGISPAIQTVPALNPGPVGQPMGRTAQREESRLPVASPSAFPEPSNSR